MSKTILASFIILCLLSIVLLVGLALNIHIVKASGTIYIRADGSIDPPTASILGPDNNTYTFTEDVTDSIVVERDNIQVDGAGYTLQGTESGTGIDLSRRSNVTIRNMEIKSFEYGIRLDDSSNNTISGNNLMNNTNYGICVYCSSNNTLRNNYVRDNGNGQYWHSSPYAGIYIEESSNNNILENNITNNFRGVRLVSSSNNCIHLNHVENNDFEGIVLSTSINNSLSGNIMNGNRYNLFVLTSKLSHYLHSVDVSNLVCGKPVYYLVNQTNLMINPETYPQVGYLALVNCVNVTVEDLTLTSNGQGLTLANTNNSRIAHNNITNNMWGIELRFSSNNTLSENNITSYRHAFGYGTTCGVLLVDTSNTLISRNNIAKNDFGILVEDSSSNNFISKNNVTNNNEGITILSGPSSNMIVGNNITNSVRGVMLREPGENNTFYKNTIANHQHRPYSNYAMWGLHISFNTFSENNITDNYGGIDFSCSDHNKLCKNNLSNNDIGIWLSDRSNHNIVYENNMNSSHVQLSGSLNNSICRNNMTRCGVSLIGSSNNSICENSMVAIALWESSNYNTISWNSIVGSDQYGIRLSESSNNVFRNNSMADNRYNFDVWGETPSDFVNDVDTSNTVDGRPIYYWIDRRDIAVPLNAGCVILVNCTNITAQNLNLKNNGQGILLAYTTNSVIKQNSVKNNSAGVYILSSSSNNVFGNDITDNKWSAVALYSSSYNNTICANNMSNNYNGIYLHDSPKNNSIMGNIVRSNRWAGVYLREASNNIIYHNNFINNTKQVHDDSWYDHYVSPSTNIWDNGYPSGGNYWSDYIDMDLYSGPYQNETGSDGIGDMPYTVDESNQDNYPLMNPITPLYFKLLEKYNELLTVLHAFNLSYNVLQAEFNSLNSTYNDLVSEFKSLSSLYNQLQGQYTSLNSSYTALQDSHYELESDRESIVNELENIRNLLYVFIATTIILIATTVYFAKRRPKIEL